ncbi:putative ribosomal protein L14 [Helianthus annuus]|nr:putative ribosomal protein L14 [Helianthus annuus]
MPFKRYVEIGRIALVNYGKDYGKLVVIVDVIDQNRALVDAPDMVRGQMNFKRLTLTDIKIDIKRVPNKKTLVAALEAADVKNKWESSSWGRKLIVQKKRASLNDFDRFKIMLAKIKVNLLFYSCLIHGQLRVKMGCFKIISSWLRSKQLLPKLSLG